MILMGMRLKSGLSAEELLERTGHTVSQEIIEKLQADELLEKTAIGQNMQQLIPTAKGTQLLNYMNARIVEGLIALD